MKPATLIYSIKQLPFLVMGMSDGLILPLSLMAGLLSAKASINTLLLAGSGVTILGSLITAIGAFTAAKDEAFDITRQLQNEERNQQLLRALDIDATLEKEAKEDDWKEITEREKDKNNTSPRQAAITVAVAYLLGGVLTLTPFLLWNTAAAFIIAVLLTACLLFSLGYIKSHLAQTNQWIGAVTLLLIGTLAIASAYLVGHLFSHS